MSGADFLDHQALEASGEDGHEGDLDESDKMLLGPVEDRVQRKRRQSNIWRSQ